MLEVGVDEFTAVLRLPSGTKIDPDDWPEEAEELIEVISEKADLIAVLGEPEPEKKAPQGYTTAYTFGKHDFYFSIAYHKGQPQMGVIIKFSAQALDYYRGATGQEVYELLQEVVDSKYDLRLSRIDIAVDYIDEDLNVTQIYKSMIDDKVGIFRDYVSPKTGEVFYRHCEMKISGFLRESAVPTIYLGSVQSNTQLRIYDKKREQLERKGTKFDKARNCKDWVRFEGTFRSEYAHQLTSELMRVQSNDEFINLLACSLVQKFRFMYMTDGVADHETEYTKMLIDCIYNNSFALRSPSSRNYELAKSVCYILTSSGAITTLYKIARLWGNKGLSDMFGVLKEWLANYKPNDDCKDWLNKKAMDYRKLYSDFDEFYNKTVLPLLQQNGESMNSNSKGKVVPLKVAGRVENVSLRVRLYQTGVRLAILLYSIREKGIEEAYAKMTINVPSAPFELKENEAFIDTSILGKAFLTFIHENCLDTVISDNMLQGFPLVAFDMEKLREFDPEGVETVETKWRELGLCNPPPQGRTAEKIKRKD